MTENKYTYEQIIDALQVRMPHDEICREAYDLIQLQAKIIKIKSEMLETLFVNNEKVIDLVDQLRVDIGAELVKTRSNAIGEFAAEIIKEVLPHFDDGSNGLVIRMSVAIVEKAKALRNKGIHEDDTKLT